MSKTFTRAEVAKHASEEDCWMVIHGKVYDVTKFLEEHPGGEEVMVEVGGRDATNEFEDVGHTDDARQQMAPYLIGTLDGKDAEISPEELKAAQAEKLAKQGSGPSSGIKVLIVPFMIVCAAMLIRYFAKAQV